MNCSNCGKTHDGYRCPYCGTFELETEGAYKRKGSLYKKQRIRAGRRQWPAYIFFGVFVIGWFALVATAVFSGADTNQTFIVTDSPFAGFGNVDGFDGRPVANNEYLTIKPKSLKVNNDGDIIAVVNVENTSAVTVGMSVYAVTKGSGSSEYVAEMEGGPTVVFEPGEKKKVTVTVYGTELDKQGVTELTGPRFRYHTYVYDENMTAEQLEGVQAFSINGKIIR